MTVEQLKFWIKQLTGIKLRFAANDQLIDIIRAHSAFQAEPEEGKTDVTIITLF